MPDFKQRRQLARLIDRNSDMLRDIQTPENGWIHAMRHALHMATEHIAQRKGVTRNAIYQAERSEKEGAISIKQMDRIAKAMGGRFVYAIVTDEPINRLKYKQAQKNAQELAKEDPTFASLSLDAQQDWIDDVVAEQLHDMHIDFWEENQS